MADCRWSFKVPQADGDRLERLRELSGAANKTETVRRALAVYEAVLRVGQDGGQLVIHYFDDRRKSERLRII